MGVMLLKIWYVAQIFLWAMPDKPQISFGQALEGFQGQISVKINGCHVGFQGQISVKVNGCHIA